MASMNTRLNIEKLDGNIVQKHGGSKQVGFKQLGPGVETGVHGVHDEKRVWFEVELQGAPSGILKAVGLFMLVNDETAMLKTVERNKQPREDKPRTAWSTQQCNEERGILEPVKVKVQSSWDTVKVVGNNLLDG
ncbi:hypothetical protein Tco_0222427 [Tanacetum coccineum]